MALQFLCLFEHQRAQATSLKLFRNCHTTKFTMKTAVVRDDHAGSNLCIDFHDQKFSRRIVDNCSDTLLGEDLRCRICLMPRRSHSAFAKDAFVTGDNLACMAQSCTYDFIT